MRAVKMGIPRVLSVIYEFKGVDEEKHEQANFEDENDNNLYQPIFAAQKSLDISIINEDSK